MPSKPEPSPQDARLLIVDDDEGQRRLLETFLQSQGFSVLTAGSAPAGLALLEQYPVQLVISDVRMPGMTGIEMLGRLRETRHALPVLLVTAYADVRDAVRAMRDGAVNYLEKPIDLDELLSSVRHALGLAHPLQRAAHDPLQLPDNIIAHSPAMRAVFEELVYVAPTESRVLITGESGVGKEVVADYIHARSPRAASPFVKVNCAAIPEPLLESELFGHERGAFTGAVTQRAGCFEQAQGGTILLDEIGEMPLALQVKLLRVAQDGSFRRVGGTRDLQANARLLATTNRDLEQDVQAGKFREDLFFRLNVFEVLVPPLRQRQPDILPLAQYFAAEFSGGHPRFSVTAITCLELYAWPGNIREMRNAIERAVLMARGDMILPEHLPPRIQATARNAESTTTEPIGGRIEDVERTVILQTLREHQYNRSETARVLGISRRALIYKLQRLREQGYITDAPDSTSAPAEAE
jgi:DNA-binding NtrC family response regulator